MEEYSAIYWAAACLVFWACRGVTDGQLADAVNMTCDMARLTATQEAVMKNLINDMKKGVADGRIREVCKGCPEKAG